MTPTQPTPEERETIPPGGPTDEQITGGEWPTPEEQVEARKIVADARMAKLTYLEPVFALLEALLTRQSQERAELEAQTRLADSSFGKAEQYLQLAKLNQAELDRERAEIEKLGVKDPVLALQALRLDYEDLQAELEYAQERNRDARKTISALGKERREIKKRPQASG